MVSRSLASARGRPRSRFAEVRAALLAEFEDGKVPVSEAAKKVGAMWKALIFLNINSS